MTRIIIIEDDPDILTLLHYNLETEGYRVAGYRDGLEGLAAVRRNPPDLLVLDLMLPGIDGFEICRELRSGKNTKALPVLVISVKDRESDIVLGLGLGADDYVTKPFSLGEVLARVKALLRRSRQPADGLRNVIDLGELHIDVDKFEIQVGGAAMVVTPTEFRILHTLASAPGNVFSRDALMDAAVGDDVIVMNHNIDVHVGSIRKKLGQARAMIETVWGVGYRLRQL